MSFIARCAGGKLSQPIHGSTVWFEFFGFVAPPSRDVAGALLSGIIFERASVAGAVREGAPMTERIQEFLRNRRNEGHDVEPFFKRG